MLGMRIGIDLGTDSIIAYAEGKGIVLSEPSVVVCDAFTGKPIAMGSAALKMTGRVPGSLKVVRPLKDGIVSDFALTEQMLRYYIQKICKSAILRPFVAVCVPSTVTRFEKRTILNVIMAAGAGNACLIEEPLAAALGAGI
ncbi:MAG: rod shape-determining protein, partial [Clostridiales bacterium]|nr:rod shape-determining protein [Clostridiales bacterium]